jgi:hypothetical protein
VRTQEACSFHKEKKKKRKGRRKETVIPREQGKSMRLGPPRGRKVDALPAWLAAGAFTPHVGAARASSPALTACHPAFAVT